MVTSRLLLFAILGSCLENIHSDIVQHEGTEHRIKRQNPADIFDSLFNQIRTRGVTLYNTLGGLAGGFTRSGSTGESSQGGNPLNILTQGATSLLTPLITTGVAAGLDTRRLLQQGANTGTDILQNGAGAIGEGSKTVNNVIGSSLDGIRNFTDLGGNFFRSIIPNPSRTESTNPHDRLFSSSRSSRDTPDSNPVTSLNRLFMIPHQIFRSLITSGYNGRQSAKLDVLRQLLFQPRSVIGRVNPRKPAGNPLEQNTQDLAENVDVLGVSSGKQGNGKGVSGSDINKIPRR